MKNLIKKVCHHGKKITIHLKRHHRKYLFGALCSGILALIGIHTASTISNTFADEEEGTICNVEYNTIEETNGGAIAYLTGCNDEIYQINEDNPISYIFTKNKTHTFWYIDLSGNIKSATAIVDWLTGDNSEISSNNTGFDLSISYKSAGQFVEMFRDAIGSGLLNISMWDNGGNRNYIGNIDIDDEYFAYYFDTTGDILIKFQQSGSDNFANMTVHGLEPGYLGQSYEISIPSCHVDYSTTSYTNDDVIAVLTGCNGEITGDVLSYTFTNNDDYTFLYKNSMNNYRYSYSFVDRIDKVPPTCNVEYSATGSTNQDVLVYLTGCSEEISAEETDYTFNENGTYTFEFQDLAGNTGSADAVVTWIDKTKPTCDVIYSTTGATTGNVTATLTGCSGTITGTDTQHIFTGNGTYTFNFQDLLGNTGNADAVVTWIDKTKPTCDVAYNTTGATTGNVTATLTGCSEAITGTDTHHTFTGNGTYTFRFQDLLGNTGSANATVTWIISGNKTTYVDIEGNEFKWEDITICDTGNTSCITLMDRNLGATTNDISKTGSYGHYFQWGNNYGFNARSLNGKVGQVDASRYGPNNPYNSGVFLYGYTSRNSVGNDNLWGGSGDSKSNHRGWDNRYTTAEGRQGPCPQGYHVPSIGERNELLYYWYNSLDSKYGLLSENHLLYQLIDQEGKIGKGITEYFYIPTAGDITTNRWQPNGTQNLIPRLIGLAATGTIAEMWSSTPFGFYNEGDSHDHFRAFSVNLLENRNIISAGISGIGSSEGLPIRCFKNSSSTGTTFSISFDDNIKPGEYTTFTVRVLKNGLLYNDYTGSILFTLTNKKGGLVNKKSYTIYNSGHYTFEAADGGRKTFYSGLKITDTGTYILEIRGLDNGGMGSGFVYVGGKHNAADFEYDTLKFNPNYSDEMNEAYQYARYFGITTKDNIKEADMYSGLNRIAMAKMLTNYAENVLGVNNYNTGRNCRFVDVSTSLDKDYDYGVTKACQLGIMGVNMPNNKFYPDGGVTRAEFATALSRLLYGTPDGVGQYYSTHLVKLYQEKIIKNTDPTLRELRGYVMLMLKRADNK